MWKYLEMWKNVRKEGAEMGEMCSVCQTSRKNVSATADPINPKAILFSLGECLLSDGFCCTMPQSLKRTE
jgi:hypothetical protein